MKALPYIDTSALAKWYVNEPHADEFAAFIGEAGGGAVSRLTLLELRCLLARRRRANELDRRTEKRILATCDGDVRDGHLSVCALEDRHAIAARSLLDRLADHPLRTLDALHLAIAADLGVALLATADRVMAGAAAALGLAVQRFD